MSNVERSWHRAGASVNSYSTWHRTLTPHGKPDLGFLDIDWIEFCSYPGCKRRLMICELAYDNGQQDNKQAWQTRNLGRDSKTNAYVVLYHTRGERDPGPIDRIRVRELWPREASDFTAYAPDEWAERLFKLRTCHPLRRLKLVPKIQNHTHGYQKDELGVYRCIQDHFAIGFAPETGCGQVWEPYDPGATA